ncbi:hypothetical protein [Salegentibacter flavus]|uniref:Uncharacterized protein n=1 Tax=Salegentibacter flavus TaxID=287099 RepID=A0A1I5DLJ5_9FLAO|nr:hypothetical protein [Salegentibacter flavus]SFN99671.1 hypothetical protein SAMN05660413_03373 [Salegentibacter flavus]
MKLELGGLYQTDFDDLPIKIIGFDDYEVLYDSQWEEGKWMFSDNLRRKSSFYRISTDFFKKKSSFIKSQDLNEKEYEIFRPDLPIRFGRYRDYSWNNLKGENLENVEKELSSESLNINRLFLIPFGPKGGLKKSVQIESEVNLTLFEVIKAAQEIQESVNNEMTNGIGIFRDGFEKGIPSYYIGEYIDRANNVLN